MSSPGTEVPVLIVGAGPAGLMSALLLEQQGVETLVVERRGGSQPAPAAHVVNARTFEICRAAGVDMKAVAESAIDPSDGGWVYFQSKLGGRSFGRLPFERQGDDQLAVTPTPLRNLSQNRFEPLLLDALRNRGREPVWRCQWEGSQQAGSGVVSEVRDLATDRVFAVDSEYLIAADGAGSRIRKAQGIALQGPERLQSFVMVHFRAALRDRLGSPPGVLYFLSHPDTGGGVFVIHDLDREATYMHAFDPDEESPESYDEARCAALIRNALEDPQLDFAIDTIGSWHMTAQVAERYREGRIFLVGDSAHRFPPTGGLGLNTGVQDAHNLAWKLALVRSGHADEAILDSYEGERRPVAQHNADQSLRNAMRLIEVPQALGITDDREASRAGFDAVLADPEGPARVERAVARQAEHFDMPGLQLGFAYERGVLLRGADDEVPVPPDPRELRPSASPGHRLPHVWLGAVSLLDWVPLDRFLLLAGPGGDAWLRAAAGDPRVTVRKLPSPESPELAEWLAMAAIGADGALLVRPDQHVAWRLASAPSDPAKRLSDTLSTLLGVGSQEGAKPA